MTVEQNIELVRRFYAAARGDRRVACRAAHAFRFFPDGRIAEVWGFVDDQSELDELFAS